MVLIFTFIFAFFDPVIFIPSALFGWFVAKRNDAIICSFIFAVGTAILFLNLRKDFVVSDFYYLKAAIKIGTALIITYSVYKYKNRSNAIKELIEK